MLGATLLAVIVSAPASEDVKALIKPERYCVSQAHSVSGDCGLFLDFYPVEVRDLACNETKWPREFACSYNILIREQNDLYPSFWEQRVDQFRLMNDGSWWLTTQVEQPKRVN